MDFLDIAALDRYAAGVCGRAGLRVVWDKAGSTPRTDNRTIWLPRMTTADGKDAATSLRYYIKHEASHCVHSDFTYLQECSPKGALALLNNLMEDNRIDYLNDAEYSGDIVTSNDYWTLYAKRIENIDPESLEQKRSVIAAFMLDALARTWISSSHLALSVMKDQASVDNLQQLETMLDAGCLQDLIAVRDIADKREASVAVMELAKKLFRILFPDADLDAHIETPSEASKTAAKPSDEDGEGDGSGKGEKTDTDDSGGSGTDDDDRIINVDRVECPVEHTHEVSRTGLHMNHSVTSGEYVPPVPDDYVIVNFPNMGRFSSIQPAYFRAKSVTSSIEENGKPLANKLRVQLQTRSKGRYEYGQKRGKLHNGSLHRVLHGNVPSAEKVFRTHKVSDTLDTAVTLLVDCSGSMSGRKFETACATAGAMAEALRPLHIAYNVLGFTNDCLGKEDPLIFNFSKFGENVPTAELVERFNRVSGMLWDNSDGDAIIYAYHQLLQRKEKRKVLLVMSDGSPSGRFAAGDIVSYTKQVTSKIYKDNIVDLYGVGIEDSNVKYYYDKHVVVERGDNLAEKVLSLIQRSF